MKQTELNLNFSHQLWKTRKTLLRYGKTEDVTCFSDRRASSFFRCLSSLFSFSTHFISASHRALSCCGVRERNM